MKPLAAEIATLILDRKEDERLTWNKEGTVRFLISAILPDHSAVKQTLLGRRKRFRAEIGKLLSEAVDQVNSAENTSQGELQKYLSNESDLHSVMIALEKADLSFQLMMQVRNKIVQAYQEIMKSQV